jgi:hypothetical protein
MSDQAHNVFMERRAQLQAAGEHWQRALAYGHGNWQGDRALVLYHKPLTDTMEVWYELPNQKPQLVIADVPASEFDINKMCDALVKADNRRVSVEGKLAEVDAHNDAIQAEQARVAEEHKEEFTDKLHHAIRKDTGNHIAPVTFS